MIAPIKSEDGMIFWILAGTAALIGAHKLLSSPAGESAFPIEIRENLKDLNAVAVRFSRIRDLFYTGYIGTGEALAQLDGLLMSIDSLRQAGKTDSSTVQELVSRIDSFIEYSSSHISL